jgi:hypothetical protein
MGRSLVSLALLRPGPARGTNSGLPDYVKVLDYPLSFYPASIKEHRLAEGISHLGAVCLEIIQGCYIHLLLGCRHKPEGHCGVNTLLEGNHSPCVTHSDLIEGEVPVRHSNHTVERIGSARPHDVS